MTDLPSEDRRWLAEHLELAGVKRPGCGSTTLSFPVHERDPRIVTCARIPDWSVVEVGYGDRLEVMELSDARGGLVSAGPYTYDVEMRGHPRRLVHPAGTLVKVRGRP